MALEMKCICPQADFRNMVSNEYSSFTLAEAAAVASGYAPCCTHGRTNQAFRRHCADPCDEMDLWEQTLGRAMAGGELKSVPNCLKPTERLIPRSDLESWMEEHNREEASEDDERNNSDPLLTQRAKAIAQVITERGRNPKAITIPEKNLLREEVEKQFHKLEFTKSTFDKAWIEGGRLGLFTIKDKRKYTKALRHPEKVPPKKS